MPCESHCRSRLPTTNVILSDADHAGGARPPGWWGETGIERDAPRGGRKVWADCPSTMNASHRRPAGWSKPVWVRCIRNISD